MRETVFCHDKAIIREYFPYQSGGVTDRAVLFIPGFGADTLRASLGPVGRTAHEEKTDFVRFSYSADMHSLTYDQTIAEAAAVALSLPHTELILVGSSYGAGALPFIVRAIHEREPDKVVGVFGFVAAPPWVVQHILERQKGFDEFSPDTPLEISVPTLPHPVPISWQQYQSVKQHASLLAESVRQNRGCGKFSRVSRAVHFLSGSRDALAPPRFARVYPSLFATCPEVARFDEVDTDSHALPAALIASGVRRVIVGSRKE